ncbi:hypothetical protein HER18_07660 [Chryseobacterium sp. NEB161]|nr:hypothetical protein HER18_07660 [Chryseobacterium sp. NEB161]
MIVTVLHKQSLLDIAIQHTGSVLNVFLIAQANGLAVSDELVAGSELTIPDVENNNDILNYYSSRAIQPATAITTIIDDNTEPKLEGIGYWIIGDDNIVS